MFFKLLCKNQQLLVPALSAHSDNHSTKGKFWKKHWFSPQGQKCFLVDPFFMRMDCNSKQNVASAMRELECTVGHRRKNSCMSIQMTRGAFLGLFLPGILMPGKMGNKDRLKRESTRRALQAWKPAWKW